MAILKYTASLDTTISDAFKYDLYTRATGSNLGGSNSLEVFSIYGQASSASLERSRILIKFPTDKIVSDRNSTKLPSSGNVDFILKLYNAEHPFTLPSEYYLSVKPLSQSWDEGYGLDMEGYRDPGAGNGGSGANWIYANSNVTWSQQGASTSSLYNYSYYIDNGSQDLSLNITDVVEAWINNTIPNHGLLIFMSGAYEDGSLLRSFYTKKFFGRTTGFFYKKPTIEALWDSSDKDSRNNFYASSSLVGSSENIQSLFLYNKYKGVYRNIPGNPSLTVKFYTNTSKTHEIIPTYISMSNPYIGIYKVSIALNTTASYLYDYWVNSSNTGTVYYSSSFDIAQYTPDDYYETPEYIINITNLKNVYRNNEYATFRIYSREKNWNPNVYSVASNDIENQPIDNLYYKIYRSEDFLTVVDYSTGSIAYTKLSQDLNGSYFRFDMSLLEPDSTYKIKFATFDGVQLNEFKETFKFRVE